MDKFLEHLNLRMKEGLEICDKHLHVLMFFLMCFGLLMTTLLFFLNKLDSSQWIDASTKLFGAASLIVSVTKLNLGKKDKASE